MKDKAMLAEKIEESPLFVINELIENSRDYFASNKKNKIYLPILKQAIFKHIGLEEETKSINELFSDKLNQSQQQIVACTLLRLLAKDSDLFLHNTVLKQKAVCLFDDELSNSIIYKKLNITPKDQTYKKLNKLIPYIQQAEKTFENDLNISTLDDINNFKHNIFTYLFGIHKYIILPFIDARLTAKSNYQSIFKDINNYLENKTLANYNRVKLILNDNLSCINNENGYNYICIFKPFNKILELIEEDFKRSPMGIPASLSINKSEKKYPFTIKNKKFNITFKIINNSAGKSFGTTIKIIDFSDNISIIENSVIVIGDIESNNSVNVDIKCKIIDPESFCILELELFWYDYSNQQYSIQNLFELESQKTNVDWDELKLKQFYSLDAIEDHNELIGRKDIISSLIAGIAKQGKSISSFYVHGQRRVGKTSIAKSLQSKINHDYPDSYFVVYLELGEFKSPNSLRTIENLGNSICNQIQLLDSKFSRVAIPVFNDSFSPIVNYLDKILSLANGQQIIIVIDEFDGIPAELYRRGDIGDSFFQTMRAISNRQKISVILVGGEKVEFIISCQGAELNKFRSISVDYFNKEKAWTDFNELIKKPVEKYIEYSANSIELLYNCTAGNPFFTNLICEQILEIMVDRRDSHITETEVFEGIQNALNSVGTEKFAHFWEDGILETSYKKEAISYNRRVILLAIADIIARNGSTASKQEIIESVISSNIHASDTNSLLKELVDRNILSEENGFFDLKIQFFKDWLIEYGKEKIITTLSEDDKVKFHNNVLRQAKIKSKEVVSLVDEKAIVYRGEKISEDSIRNWLEQFGDNVAQRHAFTILKSIKYYSDFQIKNKMQDIFGYINMKFQPAKYMLSRTGKREDILVSYIDKINNHGATYAKFFTDENQILHNNLVRKANILNTIENKDISTLVFIDDFIGSGDSLIKYIDKLYDEHEKIFYKDVNIIIGIIAGFTSSKERIITHCKSRDISNINIYICDPLMSMDRCFNDESRVFANKADKIAAEGLCYDIGAKIFPEAPLGYKDSQATVLFPETCPNNTLPIFWAETDDFKPLFKRMSN